MRDENNAIAAQVYYRTSLDDLVITTGGNNLVMNATTTTLNTDLQLNAAGTLANSAVRKDYVDGGFLSLDGGTLSGDVDLNKVTPTFVLTHNGIKAAQWSAGSVSTRLRHYSGDVTDAELKLEAGLATFNVEVRGPDPVDDAAYTPKKYVEDNFIGNTGDQTITDTNAVFFNLNSVTSTALVNFQRDSSSVGRIAATPATINIRHNHSADGTDTNIDLFDDYLSVNKEMRGVDPTNDAGLTTKGYVDDNFLSLDGGTITGDLSVQDSGTVRIEAVSTDTDAITMAMEGRTDRGRLVGSNGSYLDFYDGFINANVSIRGGEPVHDSGYTTRGYVNDKFLSLDGGTVTGIAQFAGEFRVRRGAAAAQAGRIDLYTEGDNKGLEIYSLDDRSILRHHASADNSYHDINIFTDYIQCFREFRGIDPTNDAGFTTKSYVENNFLSLTDTGTQSVAGATVFAGYTTAQGVLQVNDWLQSSFEAVRFAKPARALNAQTTTPNDLDYLTKGYVEDNFVDLTTNQNITGVKVFGSNTKFSSNVQTDILTANANSNIYVANRLGYSGAAITEIETTTVNDGTLIHKRYVENNFLANDKDQTINGSLTVSDSTTTELVISPQSATSQPILRFLQNNGQPAGIIYYDTGSSILRLANRNESNATLNELRIYDDYTVIDSRLEVDGNLDVDGDLTIKKTTPSLYLNSTTDDGECYIDMRSAGQLQMRMFSDNNTGDDSVFRMRKYTGETVVAEIQMHNSGVILSTVEHRGVDPTTATGFVTRQYAENNFLELSGGKSVNNLGINSGGTTELRMFRNNINSMGFFCLPDYAIVRRSNSSGVTVSEMRMYDTYTQFGQEVLGPSTHATNSDPASFVTKDYIDALEARIAALEAA